MREYSSNTGYIPEKIFNDENLPKINKLVHPVVKDVIFKVSGYVA